LGSITGGKSKKTTRIDEKRRQPGTGGKPVAERIKACDSLDGEGGLLQIKGGTKKRKGGF